MRGGMVAEKRASWRWGGAEYEDGFDVFEEAHVEHFVGFVEDDVFDVVELEGAASKVVEDAARGADNDVDAALEGVELALDWLAAVDGEDVEVLEVAEAVDCFGNLDGELAGWGENEGLGVGVGLIHTFDYGDGEGRGFACAGLGLGNYVAAFYEEADGLFLDGGWGFVAEVCYGF